MSRRSSLGVALASGSSNGSAKAGRVSFGGRSSIGGMMGPPVTPSAAVAVQGNGTTSSFLDVPETNLEDERRQRQLSRLQQLQNSRQFGSPDEGGDRRKSVAALEPRLTGQQLAQHYATCIQLSAENKINAKNAFNLQLIDYMTEMIKKKDSDMNNFQVASCTLDASTKIYAYRVDCVHTDTIRMAGGLGRTQQEAGQQQTDADNDDPANPTATRKKRRVKKATLETNPSNLTLSALDLEFMVDPVFKKISSQVDEGKSGGGLFLNSLMLKDDSCQLLLDSGAVLNDNKEKETRKSKHHSSLSKFSEELNAREICPSFSSFHFSSWKVGDDDESMLDSSALEHNDQGAPMEHVFDINAVPEPLDDDANADFYGGGADEGFPDDVDDSLAATLGEGGNNTCLTVGWGAQHAGGADSTATVSILPPPTMETIHLKDHLASMPLEYSYFNTSTALMMAWAGPGHWKFKTAYRDKMRHPSQAATEGRKKRKKADFKLEYQLLEDVEKYISSTKRGTKLSDYTIKTWSEDKTTLPVDVHFDPSDFAKLHLRSSVVVRRLIHELTTLVEAEGGGEDGAAVAERDDDGGAMHHNDDMNDADDGDVSGGAYDMTLFSQTLAGPSQQLGHDFWGDNLVEAPNKVAKINIGYARTAKRMDMKKLKSNLWEMLTATTVKDKENDCNSANVSPSKDKTEKDAMNPNSCLKFSDIYHELPRRLPIRMAENLSLPLAFIALLHLCNERNLALEPSGNMQDFAIRQG